MGRIGIFDSGVGGLTVVKELIKLLPYEDIIYFGDTARVPYGGKSAETVVKFSLENTLFLLKHNIKILVVACNTSSSLALPVLRHHFKIPVVGVIYSGARAALYATKNKRIGIIGTRATIQSRAYEKQLTELDSSVRTFSQACSLFVPLVEEGWIDNEVALQIARLYLAPLKRRRIDTLILGCTHYPLLKGVIQKVMGQGVGLIDSAYYVAIEVQRILDQEGLLETSRRSKGRQEYFVSDDAAGFRRLAESFLTQPIKEVFRFDGHI